MHAVHIQTSVGQCMESSGEVWLSGDACAMRGFQSACRSEEISSFPLSMEGSGSCGSSRRVHGRGALRDVDGGLRAVYSPGVA